MNLTTTLQSVSKYLFIIICSMAIGYFLRGASGCKKSPEAVTAINDSTTQKRSEYASADTSMGFIEPLYKTHLKPTAVYQQKAKGNYDSLTKRKDLVTSVKATKSEISFFTYNQNDSLIKQEVFENHGRGFTAVATENGMYVKQDKFFLRTLMLAGDFKFTGNKTDWNSIGKSIGLKTRLEYEDKFEIELGVKHDFNNSLSLQNIEANIGINLILIK